MPRHELKLNDDGTITVPVKVPKGEPERNIELDEPSMDQIAEIQALIDIANEKMPKIRVVTDPANVAEVEGALDDARARGAAMFSKESPYGECFRAIITLMTGEALTGAELYAWGSNVSTCQAVLNHFTAPLGGPAATDQS